MSRSQQRPYYPDARDMVKGQTFESREEPVILEKAMNPSSADLLTWVVWGLGEKTPRLPD